MTETTTKLIDLFPIPVYIGKVKRHNEIKKYILERVKEYGTPSSWNCSVNSSFGQDNSWLYDLTELYTNNYDEYFQQFNLRCDMHLIDIWYNEYMKSQYQERHHHLPADISCIHYIKLHSSHYGTTFINPYYLHNASNTLMNHKSPHTFTPYVEEGDIVIFPSYLEHFVRVQNVDHQRVTLSWNYRLSNLISEGA
jgi:hypothetical protein